MLPRKSHIDEINRYHDTIDKLGKQINAETNQEKKAKLAMDYYTLTKVWIELDEVIEFTVKHTLDCIENGDDPEE